MDQLFTRDQHIHSELRVPHCKINTFPIGLLFNDFLTKFLKRSLKDFSAEIFFNRTMSLLQKYKTNVCLVSKKQMAAAAAEA